MAHAARHPVCAGGRSTPGGLGLLAMCHCLVPRLLWQPTCVHPAPSSKPPPHPTTLPAYARAGLHRYKLRLCFEVVDLAPALPAVVNHHEARAYANWLSAKQVGACLSWGGGGGGGGRACKWGRLVALARALLGRLAGASGASDARGMRPQAAGTRHMWLPRRGPGWLAAHFAQPLRAPAPTAAGPAGRRRAAPADRAGAPPPAGHCQARRRGPRRRGPGCASRGAPGESCAALLPACCLRMIGQSEGRRGGRPGRAELRPARRMVLTPALPPVHRSPHVQ